MAAPTAAVLRAPMLCPGDRVRLVSPAGPPDAARVARGVELLAGWGLVVEYAEHALDRHGYLAGADDARAADLAAALADPGVRGVVATRGGYGTQRILDRVDLAAVCRDPKVVVGFSDLTALQLALWRAARLATVHGPGVAWDDVRTGAESAESLRAALMSADPVVLRRDPAEPTAPVEVAGRAGGALLGGNLTLLDATVGHRDFPSLDGAILLLEEVGEAPYRIDRMLTRLRRTGLLDGLAGVALGQFTGCTGQPGTPEVAAVLDDRLGDLGIPVLGGLPVGHGVGQRTLPLGVPARLDTEAGTLIAEAAVTP